MITSDKGKGSGAILSDEMLAGAFSGAVARTLTAPLDVLKIRFQIQYGLDAKYRYIWPSLKTIVAEEGFWALWKGNLSATYLWTSYSMIQFGMYSFFKNGLSASSSSSSAAAGTAPIASNVAAAEAEAEKTGIGRQAQRAQTLRHFVSGAAAAVVATTATYPLDIMRTHFAIQGRNKVVTSMSDFFHSTYYATAESGGSGGGGGVRGFYKGLVPAVAGVGPYMGLNFAIYEAGMRFIAQYNPLPAIDTLDGNGTKRNRVVLHAGFAGGVSGTLSKLAVYPLDTVKKRMQLQALRKGSTLPIPRSLGLGLGLEKTPFYRGMTHCLLTMYTTEGFLALYKGIVPTLLKSFVSTAITFAAYEKGKEIIHTYK